MAPIKKTAPIAATKSKARLDASRKHHRMLTRRRLVNYGLRNVVRNAWLTISA